MLDSLSSFHGRTEFYHGGTINIAKFMHLLGASTTMQVGGFRHTTSDGRVGGKRTWRLVKSEQLCCRQWSVISPSTTPRAGTWTPRGSLGSPSAVFGKGFWAPLDALPAHLANLKAAGGRHTQQLMGYAQLWPISHPRLPSWCRAAEVSLTHHFFPSYLPPAGLSIMIRGFLPRDCCQSPFHHPNSSTDNVWLISHPSH